MKADIKVSGERLEERLAALHSASLELVQDIAIDSLLQRIVRIACEQVNAHYGAIEIGGEIGQGTSFFSTSAENDGPGELTHPPLSRSLMGVIAESDGPIRVDYAQNNPKGDNNAEDPQMTSLLGVPIRLADRHLGQIYLVDKVNALAFNVDDEQVIDTLAAYAAVAINHARSYNEIHARDLTLTRRNQDLALLNNLASTLASITELDELLETALQQVMNYFDVDKGEIYLSEDGHHALHKVLHQGKTNQPIWTQERFTLKESLIGQTARRRNRALVLLPYHDDPYLRNEELLAQGIQQIACFPLTSRSEVLGVLSIAFRQEEMLDPMDQQLLSSIASWVGTTIENVNLNIQGRRLAVLEERNRIGMDLHDGIIQSIYAVGLTLEHARLLINEEPEQTRKRINQSIEDLNNAIRDLRAFIMDMRPRQLYEEDLMDGLQRLVNEFHANALVETKLSGPGEGLDNLPDAYAIALFHICQEALANIAKHARATAVEVLVWTTQDRILMEIHDDGIGFDPQKVQLTLGHGISNMKTRARNVGGDLEITSEPGKGTTILVWMPHVQDDDSDALE